MQVGRGRLYSLVFVEKDVCALIVFVPMGVERLHVSGGDDVDVGNLLYEAECLVDCPKIIRLVFAFGREGVKIEVAGEEGAFLVVAFEENLAAGFLCDEVRFEGLEL